MLGLFRHAICQSGSAIARWPVKEDPKSAAVKLAEKLGCPTSSSEAIVACLKNEKSGEEIVKADIRVWLSVNSNCTLIFLRIV